MWVTLVSSIKTATMRELVHLSLCAHPNGMITNPQTHQRGLGGRGKKKRGSTEKRENVKLKYSATSEGRNKRAWFPSASPEKDKKGRERDR